MPSQPFPTSDYSAQQPALGLDGGAMLDLIQQILQQGSTARFRGVGFSMLPFIRDQDLLSLAPLGRRQPSLGDVVACLRPDGSGLLVHRVIRIQPGACLLKGDNALTPDGLFPAAGILGRLVRLEREGKTLRLGLGPERRLVALLSRWGWLLPLVRLLSRLKA